VPPSVERPPTGVIIVDAMNGTMLAYPDTGLNLAHLDDVAAHHLLAPERSRIGERRVPGSENLTLRHVVDAMNSYRLHNTPR